MRPERGAPGKWAIDMRQLTGIAESSAVPVFYHLIGQADGMMYFSSIPWLSLWERWPSGARTERENDELTLFDLIMKKIAGPSQSPAVTALPKGEPRVCCIAHLRELFYDQPAFAGPLFF